MSNYTPLVSFKTEFEGDEVTMNLDQLSRETFMSWTPYMSLMDEDGKLDEVLTVKLIGEASTMLPIYVKDFRGLKDADGNAVSLDTVVEKVYFIQLVTEIVMQLIVISKVGQEGKDTEGKSAGLLPDD